MAAIVGASAQLNGQQLNNRVQGETMNEDIEKDGTQLEQTASSGRDANAIGRLRAHLNNDVSTAHADVLMLTCCFISGLVDSTIYNAYGTFVSMQTGKPFLCFRSVCALI